MYTVFNMLKAAVAKSMSCDISCLTTCGKRRRGPEFPALFIPEIITLSFQVAYRIVVPGCEPVLMRIFQPGITLTAF